MSATAKPEQGPRSEYDPANHIPKGIRYDFEEAWSTGRCYLNLKDDWICPRCGGNDTTMRNSGGPLMVNWKDSPAVGGRLKVFVRVYRCEDCNMGYINAECVE